MSDQHVAYLIVGGGLAGASAIEGIRERDKRGSILLVGAEGELPYDRPPLTKGLWLGKKTVPQIFLHDEAFYRENGVALALRKRVVAVDAAQRSVTDDGGKAYRYDRLLLATGGSPHKLLIPGGDLAGLLYYRTLGDYERLREAAAPGARVAVIGGGFIGSEIAAALAVNKVDVTMIFPGASLVNRIFPADLSRALTKRFEERSVRILAGQRPRAIAQEGRGFTIETERGTRVAADAVIVGIGIAPELALAKQAGIRTSDGIEVDEHLTSSDPRIFAAGDNASFPYQALVTRTRVEHWDNALNQGKHAGRTMAGAAEPFTHMPYFFSDLFEFGYEAVGEIDASLETAAFWEKEFDTGVIYYLKDGRVRGAMMCNVWEKVDAARELIRRGVAREELAGAIA